ncbi:MAG TPA: hypothetical protein PKH19_00670, partial [Candidatus Syntrophosphaera sp.]|nr:hypothetical protein [Candidatus Syntrophosphaera sp.]
LTPETGYTFTVRAVDASNAESADSNAVTVTTAALDATPPTLPESGTYRSARLSVAMSTMPCAKPPSL